MRDADVFAIIRNQKHVRAVLRELYRAHVNGLHPEPCSRCSVCLTMRDLEANWTNP